LLDNIYAAEKANGWETVKGLYWKAKAHMEMTDFDSAK
jgi:hypothetical protein